MSQSLKLAWAAGLLIALLGTMASLSWDAKAIPLATVLQSLVRFNPAEIDQVIIRDSRLPRAISSFLVGGMLAMAGALMQAITRNPLAEPSIMGLSQGAMVAVALAITGIGPWAALPRPIAALLGSLAAGGALLAAGLVRGGHQSATKLILAGTGLSMFCMALAATIALLGNRAQELAFWAAGGFANQTWSSLGQLVLMGGSGSLVIAALSPRLNILALGDETATSLGLNPNRLRFIALLALMPVCAGCVGAGGVIPLAGLIVPVLAGRWAGRDYRRVMPLAFCLGGGLLLWSDLIAKTVSAPYEIPVGLFTTLLGVPFFLHLVRRRDT